MTTHGEADMTNAGARKHEARNECTASERPGFRLNSPSPDGTLLGFTARDRQPVYLNPVIGAEPQEAHLMGVSADPGGGMSAKLRSPDRAADVP